MKRTGLILLALILLFSSSVPALAQIRLNLVNPFVTETTIFDQIFYYIKNDHIYDIDIKKCQYEILKNLSPREEAARGEKKGPCLDGFSAFQTPDEMKAMSEEQAGHFGGIGIELQPTNNKVVIKRVTAGGPAEKSGLRAGDVIIKAREEKDADWTVINNSTDAVKKIRGPAGTAIFIAVKRAGAEVEFKVVREDIKIKSVESKVVGNIGYVHLKSFTQTSADELEDNLRVLRGQGVNKVVFDLRNNPGGALGGALETLFYFSKKESDIMLTIKWKKREDVDTVGNSKGQYVDPKTNVKKNPGEFADMKMVVLVNKNSASASEVTAGTLQDWGYKIIGETTFKKGVGQTIFLLVDGSGLRLTTFEFFAGNGKRKVHDVGIKPDVELKWQPEPGQKPEDFAKEYIDSFGDPTKDPQLKKAIEVLNSL